MIARIVLAASLAAVASVTWGQATPNKAGSDPGLQIQKPAVQPLQTQQLPDRRPASQQRQAGSTAASKQEGEILAFPLPKGWKQVTFEQEFNIRTTQFIPEGQTKDKWDEMIRSRIFYFVRDAPLETFLLQAASIPRDRCEDVTLTPIAKGLANGYASMFAVRLCTRDKTSGHGEVAMIKVIQGRDSLYIGERAWHMKAYAKDQPPVPKEKFDQWVASMGAFTVCDQRDPARPCPKAPSK